MTILFPGRKTAPPPGYNARIFRDAVVRCIATRVDKRSIVHDYAVSPDNVVFVPTQDESQWAEDSSDWSAYVTLRLYTPDFVEGRMTGNAILHAMWQMYQDGQVRAVPQDEWAGKGPLKHRLPTLHRHRTKFGIEVGEEADKYYSFQDPDTYSDEGYFPTSTPQPGQQAREQYMNHHRRVVSAPAIEDPWMSFNNFGIEPPPAYPLARSASTPHGPSRNSQGARYGPPPGIAPPPGMRPPPVSMPLTSPYYNDAQANDSTISGLSGGRQSQYGISRRPSQGVLRRQRSGASQQPPPGPRPRRLSANGNEGWYAPAPPSPKTNRSHSRNGTTISTSQARLTRTRPPSDAGCGCVIC